MARAPKFLPVWLAALLLGAMFALALTSLDGEAPTFDEQGFLVRGLAYLRGEAGGGSRTIRVGHPLGLSALNAALLVGDPTVKLPSDDPSIRQTSFHRPAELFLWGIGNDVERVMFLARVPTIWLGLLLAAVGGRWAREMVAGWGVGRFGVAAASLIALALLTLDPNILAHTRLTTTDLGLAAGAGAAGYTLWRFLRRPSWAGVVLAGVGLGLLQNTKFTALLFLPLFGMVILLALWQRRRTGRRALGRLALWVVLVYPAVALLTLWATNGFQVGPLAAPLPLVGSVGGAAVPLADHLDQLLDIGGRLQVGTPAFLLGQYSDSGWWYYFPVAFLLKTPLPTLILLIYAIIRIVIKPKHQNIIRRGKHQPTSALLPIAPIAPTVATDSASPPPAIFSPLSQWFDIAAILIPALGYFVIALTTDINLGYRHLLPVLPFLYVLIGAVVGQAVEVGDPAGEWRGLVARFVAPASLLWLLAAALWIHPHYISFFNLLAGGPDNGWRALVDSNFDWGQDLGRLADWLDDHDVARVWLSYFGEARPEYYGIAYDGLDSFPPRLMNPDARPFYPPDPAPGWYAISATTLQGVHFADHDLFQYFREREPDAKVGYSIFLYEQPARGEPVDLLLSNVQLDAIAADDYALLGTNDARPRWFDGTRALVLPDGQRPVWLVMPDGEALHPSLEPFVVADFSSPSAQGNRYHLFRVEPEPQPGEGQLMQLADGAVAFLAAPQIERSATDITVVTAWRQAGQPRPVKLFVHLLDESGAIVSQWDGLDAAWEGWRVGDTLLQTSVLPLPADLPAGRYRLSTGLYDPETNQRWRYAGGQDVVSLGELTIP